MYLINLVVEYVVKIVELIIHAVPTMRGLLAKVDKTTSYSTDGLVPAAVLETVLIAVSIIVVVEADKVAVAI